MSAHTVATTTAVHGIDLVKVCFTITVAIHVSPKNLSLYIIGKKDLQLQPIVWVTSVAVTKQCVNKWITLHAYFSNFRNKEIPIRTITVHGIIVCCCFF